MFGRIGWLVLILVALVLAVVATVGGYNSFVPGTDIDTYKVQLGQLGQADTLATLYGAALLVGCAALSAWVIRRWRGCITFHWAGLVLVFLLLAVEKITNGNEVFFNAFRDWISQIDYFRDNWYWYTTAMFAGLFGLVFLIIYIPFLIHLNWRARLLFALGGILFVAGSFGIDLASTYFIQDHRYMEVTQQTALIMAGLGGVELFVETLSSIVFLSAIYRFGVDKGFWEKGMNPVSMDTVRADFDRLAGVESAGWNHNNHYHPFLLRHLPPHIGQALEIGCGKGAFSRLLADRAEHVVAIDLSGEMLGFAQAASAAYTNIDYRQCDVLEWDIPRESFDCIATIATLHHLPLEPVFLKVRDVLKPGGVLLVLDLYTAQTPMDYLWGAAGIPVSRLLKVLKRTPRQSQAVREAWEAHSAHDSYPALAEVRAAADLHLPGAQVRRHLLWRYSLVWRKP